jgi:DNA replication licensing factor MCM6
MREQEKVTMYIDFSHLASFPHEDPEFMSNVVKHFYKNEPFLRKGLEKFMLKIAQGDASLLSKSYFTLAIYNLPQSTKIRELRTLCLGRLMSVYGTVTRTTDAKPELILGSFQCNLCQSIVSNVEQQFKFTEPTRCSNPECGNKTQWELLTKQSTLVDWQKVRVQEYSSDIPAGSMPRSIDVILRGEIVDIPKPGDKAVFTGKLVVVPDVLQMLKPGEKITSQNVDTTRMKRNDAHSMDGVSGLRKIGVKDLTYKMVFISSSVSAGDTRFGFSSQNSADDEEKV